MEIQETIKNGSGRQSPSLHSPDLKLQKKGTSNQLPTISEGPLSHNDDQSRGGMMSPISPVSVKSGMIGTMEKALLDKAMNSAFQKTNSTNLGSSKGRSEDDPNRALEEKLNKTRVQNMVIYITDFMKTVLESGNIFTSSHFFILLLQMTPDDLKPENRLEMFLPVLIKELTITKVQFKTFIEGILDEQIKALW